MTERRFTIRLKPLLGESLFSFMSRLATVNGTHIYTLCNIVKVQENKQLRPEHVHLMNLSPKSNLDSKKLAVLSGLNEEDILSMSGYYLLRRFSTSLNVSRARFVSGMLRDRLYYCPQSMNEKAYYKLLWSMNDIEICALHKVTLNHKCMHCNREIFLKDITEINSCPYCKRNLSDCSVSIYSDGKKLSWQYWLYSAFSDMLAPCEINLDPSDAALKVIYVLNRCYPVFNKDLVANRLNNKVILATLLQRARDSMQHRRVMHLSFILKILYDNNISIHEFICIYIPDTFIRSLEKNETIDRVAKAYCLASWCNNYGKKGKLIRTGSKQKKNDSGDISKAYMICTQCGCEYAYDINDEIYERTYFIKAFNLLKCQADSDWTVKSLSKKLGLKKEGVYRCLAYFNSRSLISNLYNRYKIIISIELAKKFIDAIKSGEDIIKIRKWPVWQNYYHYLIHRYHIDVIIEISRSHCNKGKKIKINNNTFILIENILQSFLEQDIDISLEKVCKEVKICSETASKYGFSALIAAAKERQKYLRIQKLKNEIDFRAKEYFQIHSTEIISAGELYSFLGIRREILWRGAPELTAELMELRKVHNKHITKTS